LLTDVQLRIAPGEHVAIVGASGAGKSSLLGLLLGWQQPTQGSVWCDGEMLDAQQLRQHSVWLDPSVQLWDRSLFHNLTYAAYDDLPDLSRALRSSELQSLLETLPDGLQTRVGEGGCRLSGGEGQRVRFARGLLQATPKLALLDEPFRGLDRAQRARLLAAARKRWANATMLCVTHDITETMGFARVLVVEAGRVVEDGAPDQLAARASSRYAALLRSERALLEDLFGGSKLRRVRLEDGQLRDVGATVAAHESLSGTLAGLGRVAR
jgi:ATP-binding cassette subfamily B protein